MEKESKFNLGDRVYFKSYYNVEAIIIAITWSTQRQTEYKVVYARPYYAGEVTDFGLRDYIGPKYEHATVRGDELVMAMSFKKAASISKSNNKACECGMEKHGFANHSNWCPKHEG